MLILFTDTDTDMTPSLAREYGYHLISMPYIIDDKVIYPYEDFEEFNYKEFYEMLRKELYQKLVHLVLLNILNILNLSLKMEMIFYTFIFLLS